jgi:hypothetical protein
MIRVRRVRRRLPIPRVYEIEISGHEPEVLGRGRAVSRLGKEKGIGDAWAFIEAADRQAGALEYDHRDIANPSY